MKQIKFDRETLVKSVEDAAATMMTQEEPTYWRIRALAAEEREVALQVCNAKYRDALNMIAQMSDDAVSVETAKAALGLPTLE